VGNVGITGYAGHAHRASGFWRGREPGNNDRLTRPLEVTHHRIDGVDHHAPGPSRNRHQERVSTNSPRFGLHEPRGINHLGEGIQFNHTGLCEQAIPDATFACNRTGM